MDNNKLFSIWIKNIPHLNILDCIESWLNLNYIVTLFIDENLRKYFPIHENLELVDIESTNYSPEYLKEFPQIFSDYFRYNYIFQNGGTYIDSDIFLLRELPSQPSIINTEYTNQSGALKSEALYRPTNNLIRFKSGESFLQDLLEVILKNKKIIQPNNKNNTILLKPFIKLLKTKYTEYCLFYLQPNLLSPYSFSTIKHLGKNDGVVSKYGVQVPDIRDIVQNSIGIHLYNNINSEYNLTTIIKKELLNDN